MCGSSMHTVRDNRLIETIDMFLESFSTAGGLDILFIEGTKRGPNRVCGRFERESVNNSVEHVQSLSECLPPGGSHYQPSLFRVVFR